MYHNSFPKGFTLIELLVTLVLLGLISSVVSPAIFKWMESREADAKRTELQNAVSALPLKALFANTDQIITDSSNIEIESDTLIKIEKPITVTKNGYCVGGQITATIGDTVYSYNVDAPFCTITRM